MADKSKIEWTDATWSPVLGCTKVSEGCRSCYAMRTGYRMSHNPNPGVAAAYAGLTVMTSHGPEWTGQVRMIEERLALPLRWRKPKRVFVNSQSDLFHESVPDEFIDRVFAVMAWASRHQFQVLTKRPERMQGYSAEMRRLSAHDRARRMVRSMYRGHPAEGLAKQALSEDNVGEYPWPLPNVWLGVSVEDQATADARIPLLLQTPAAVRFLSCEPLLGPISARRYLVCGDCRSWMDRHPEAPEVRGRCWTRDLHWVIAGGESGPRARPCHPQWLRDLRDQCQESGVPCFFKQFGEWLPKSQGAVAEPGSRWGTLTRDGEWFEFTTPWNGRQEDAADGSDGEATMVRVGKHRAGRILDGRTWDEFPEVTP